MENFIFERLIRIFGDFLEDFLTIFEEFWRNWFVVRRRLRISLNQRTTKKMRFWGHYGLYTASEVRPDLRFEIYGQNYICYPVCLVCFDPFFLTLTEDERRKKTSRLYLSCLASQQLIDIEPISCFSVHILHRLTLLCVLLKCLSETSQHLLIERERVCDVISLPA